nr:hypothetical protein NG677_17135 [Methylobacterium sp. OTU13CASTA1]
MIARTLAQRVAKLVPLLASDKDGEVIAAARAIARTLTTAGTDLHDLADTLNRMQTVAEPRPNRDAASNGDAGSAAPWNYANEFRQAEPVGGAPDHPDAMTRKFGLPIFRQGAIGSWQEVCQHCFTLNRSIARKHGGRFLRDFEVKILTDIMTGKRWPTNANASWIETVVARCHQARDLAAEAKVG